MNVDKAINVMRYLEKIDKLKNENELYEEKNDIISNEIDKRVNEEKEQREIELRRAKGEIIIPNSQSIFYKEEEIRRLTQQKLQLEADVRHQNQYLSELKDEHEFLYSNQQKDFTKQISTENMKLLDLQEKVEALEEFEKHKEQLEAELETLEKALSDEKKERKSRVAEKQREKVQATEKLRRDMLYRIKETKAELLSLNETQL